MALFSFLSPCISLSQLPPLVHHVDLEGQSVDLLSWHPDFLDRCYFLDRNNAVNDNTKLIEKLLYGLKKDSNLSGYFLDIIQETKTAFCVDDKADNILSCYDSRKNIIVIKNYLPFDQQMVFFVHELRHVDHASRGFLMSLDYDMKEMARLMLALEADAQALTTLYAWRMRIEGRSELWTMLMGMENYADIAHAFEKEMINSNDDLLATRAAFEQWYAADWRTEDYYFSACMSYIFLQERTHMAESHTLLPETYFDDLCRLPDGENYGCHLTDEIQ